jgi:hypothetical protein
VRASIILNCSRAAPIVHFLRQRGREMQVRSKAYKHFISVCRSFRNPVSPQNQSAPTSASPALAYTAAVLALLLTILEMDLHRADLHLIGLMSVRDQVDTVFLSLLSP